MRLLAVVLQQATTARLPGFHGGIGQAGQLAATSPHAATALAHAFGLSFAVALATAVAMFCYLAAVFSLQVRA